MAAQSSTWMIVNGAVSTGEQYPAAARGGATTTQANSTTKNARRLLITNILVINDGGGGTFTLLDGSGVGGGAGTTLGGLAFPIAAGTAEPYPIAVGDDGDETRGAGLLLDNVTPGTTSPFSAKVSGATMVVAIWYKVLN